MGSAISPKEHAESADATTKMLGSGPFLHTDTQAGVSLTFKKNPDYFDKPYPYFDELKLFGVTDPAKRVADFSSKQVDLTWLMLPDPRDRRRSSARMPSSKRPRASAATSTCARTSLRSTTGACARR